MSEYARVYSVETRHAGANLEGAHLAGVSELHVIHGWDFYEEGGEASVEDLVLTYSEAIFPDPDDEDDDIPVVLRLVEPLGVALDDGAFVRALPGGETKHATLEAKGEGEPIVAVVNHALVPNLADGIRGDETEAETVLVEQDTFGEWTVVDVVARRPTIDLSFADESVELPPVIIPSEGVTQYAQLIVDEAVFNHIEGDVAVLGSLTVALRDPDQPEQPLPGSNVVTLDATDGTPLLEGKRPTGDVDAEGNPLYETLVSVPAEATDSDGNKVPVYINCTLRTTDRITAPAITLNGSKDEGDSTEVGVNHEVVLANAVTDPDTEPLMSFGLKSQRWPGTASNAKRLGWGTQSGFVVNAAIYENDQGSDTVFARFTNPDTGLLDHSTEITIPFTQVGGFTAGAGRLYVLNKFDPSGPWAVMAFNADTGVFVTGSTRRTRVQAGPLSRMCLSFDAGRVIVSWRDADGEIRQESWNDSMNDNQGPVFTGITAGGRLAGSAGEWVAVGSRLVSKVSSSRNISTPGPMRSFGQKPSGGTASGEFCSATDSSGLTRYNIKRMSAAIPVWGSWTKHDTSTGNETRQSPRAQRSWPPGTWLTIESGATGTGYDNTRIYASGDGGLRTQMHLLSGVPVGQVQTTIAEPPTTGANPPATNTFEDTASTVAPGRVRSRLTDSAGEPVSYMDGDGDARFMKVFQAGEITASLPTVGSVEEFAVTFDVPFTFPPTVGTGTPDTNNPTAVFASAVDITATGFNLRVVREKFSGSARISWQAMAKTQ